MKVHSGAEQAGDLSLETDVVVVGSGAGGAVVAAELAEAGQRVLVLEEGAHTPPERYGQMRPSEQLRAMWRRLGMTAALGVGDTPMINVMMGRTVGGSSTLTGGVCFRIPEPVLRQWHGTHGLQEMTPALLEPCHAAVEKAVHVEEVPLSMRSRSTALFAEGAAKLGYALKPLRRNTSGCEGLGRCNFGCPKGAKLSVDLTYLPRAASAGAELYSDCRVERILTRGDRAVGVAGRLLAGGRAAGRLTVRARRVVVAAGAYHSPLLLQASGVGRRSGQVGRNLTLHPSFRVTARFDEEVRGWLGAMQSAYSDAFEHEGITLLSVFNPPGVVAVAMPGIGPEHVTRARSLPHLAVFGALIHDQGGGRVRRLWGREPTVTYRMAREDRARVPRALRLVAQTFFAAGAREVFLPVLGSEPVTADQLATLDLEHVPGRRFECGSQHPLGTCRMGVSPERSVVDPDGQAWDLKELYVVDGSILPTSLGVNPQLSVMTLATRIAWKMRERPLPQA
ncbi:MAG: GMC family oxidoreductase N-terminal domain-containing protein [Myxococcales bacterium]